MVNNSSTLALVIESFVAQREGNTNILHWISSQNINAGEFYVERSNDGSDFKAIGQIEIKGSANATSYSYTDESPVIGLNYYRIKVATADGNIFYTSVKRLDNSNGLLRALIYPNPTGKTLHLHLNAVQNGGISIKIYSADGKLVVEKNIIANGATDYPLNVSNLSTGNYFMVLKDSYGLTKLEFSH